MNNRLLDVLCSSNAVELLRSMGSELSHLISELWDLRNEPGTRGHKDNFEHTLQVLQRVIDMQGNVDVARDSEELVIRLVAVYHDVGKTPTKRLVRGKYTFHGHEEVSAKMFLTSMKKHFITGKIVTDAATIIRMHGRPKSIVGDGIPDSAVRRLMADAGDLFYPLIQFCKCDSTTKDPVKRQRYSDEMDTLLVWADKVSVMDEEAKWRPPVDGYDIMEILGVEGKKLGAVKSAVIEAIKSGRLADNRGECLEFIRNYKF
jgi:poly(A) polymerase